VLIACNCDYGCPCNFNAPPTKGYCEGGWTWHVETGLYGDTVLDGLTFSVFVKWPGPIHEGNGHALILVDEQADGAQREAIETLVGGDVGCPWGVLGCKWPTIDGPHAAQYELELDGVNSRLRAGDWVDLAMEPIRNPVSGAEVHPGAVLPEGLVCHEMSFGASKKFVVNDGVSYDHSGQYTAIAPFEYAGP
jgi:hypothetical protein